MIVKVARITTFDMLHCTSTVLGSMVPVTFTIGVGHILIHQTNEGDTKFIVYSEYLFLHKLPCQ